MVERRGAVSTKTIGESKMKNLNKLLPVLVITIMLLASVPVALFAGNADAAAGGGRRLPEHNTI